MKTLTPCFVLPILLFTAPIFAEKPPLPSQIIPDGLGYNIHFTDAKPGEMEMIADSGATIVRMDFGWNGTEREKGKYDFSAFERLTDSLEKHKIRPLYILDYSNRLYDEGLSPYSDEGRKAFATWAAAAAVHFKGRNILWEMYNEPNISFWKPQPKPEDYIKLALEVGKALCEAAPDELYIGPATSEIDIKFLEQCFKAGLLEYWDAVSVHPYRQTGPETVIDEYAKLRYIIDKYAPPNKKIPILSAEWGYSSVWGGYDDDKQGKMLPRQWMVNLACDVPISIWYDWHDDGTDIQEPEHHFGTTNHAYKQGQMPVYEPKPSYLAAKTFCETFRGLLFNKRLWTGNDDEFVFLFNNDETVKLAVWTTAKEAKTITIDCPPGEFEAISYLGEKLPAQITKKNPSLPRFDYLGLTLTDSPIYLTKELDANWREIVNRKSLPLAIYQDAVRLDRLRSNVGKPSSLHRSGDSQYSKTVVANPITLGMPIPIGNNLVLSIDNSSGESLQASGTTISLTDIKGLELTETSRPLSLPHGETAVSVLFPLKTKPTGKYAFTVRVPNVGYDEVAAAEGFDEPIDLVLPYTAQMLDDVSERNTESLNAAWGIFPDGDGNVGSEQKIEMSESGRVKITYKFDDGWKFLRLAPKEDVLRTIDDKPKELGVLIEGDGSGNVVRLRFEDAKGQTFQVNGGTMSEKKPYYFSFPLTGTEASHWGGQNDGVVVYPIRFDSLIIDGTRKASVPHSVEISSMVLVY